jgi:hypothetical protein
MFVGSLLYEANFMAGVFHNIDPPPPSPSGECVPPPLVRGEDTLARRRGGWGVNILEDVRHSSVLYVCKYFVVMLVFSTQLCELLPL